MAPSYFERDDKALGLKISEEGNLITVVSGESELVIDKENFSMKLIRDGRLITASEGGSLAYIEAKARTTCVSSSP